MCPFPAESNICVNEDNLIKQFDDSFTSDDINDYNHITLFCNGNFFNEKEISEKVINYIFEKISKSCATSITVETLPQFVNEKIIKKIKDIIGDKKLQVFMGLQSSNEFLQKYSINTTCSIKSFEKAVKILFKYDFLPAAFVLIKPPFLTDEEAKNDVIETLKYLDSIGVKNSTLCPMRISDGTLLKKMYEAGFYYPLNLWIVVDILKEYSKFGIGLPMVNTTELKQYVNEDSVCAYSCEKCNEKIIDSIEQFLFSRDATILEKLDCTCRGFGINESNLSKIEIQERIKRFYELENKKG